MQQLTPQDAFFLSMESDQLPAHIGGLSFLEPVEDHPFSYESFVEFASERLTRCERFSWRLQEVPFGLDRPYWVRAENFDPTDHFDRIAIPSPYSEEALAKLVGMLFEQPLDRGRPLWEMTLIEGIPGGRFVLLWKVHHSMMDGAAGASLIEQLFDISPDAVRPEASSLNDETRAEDRIPARDVMRRAIRNAASLPLAQSRHAAKALQVLLGERAKPASPSTAVSPPKQTAGHATSTAPETLAPRASFNGVIGMHRGIAWSSVSLADVKHLKNALSVTVNDVILGITAGALREYLSRRDALPEESLVASVPCSMREADDKSLGNQVREMPIRWSTDIADPIERVLTIHADANQAKTLAKKNGAFDMIGMMSEALLPGALQLLMRGASIAGDRIPLPANAVVSNVPMTPFPLYCAGARIAKAVPLSLLAPTQGLNITVVSYCGELHFGIVHDPKLLPDPWELAGEIAKNLQQLQHSVDRELNADPR
jgi:WS/DGAT/MGAT family acyltransferase